MDAAITSHLEVPPDGRSAGTGMPDGPSFLMREPVPGSLASGVVPLNVTLNCASEVT